MTATSWRPSRCWCIAHRGGADEAAENTLAAFRHATAVGADMVEMDARTSRDGVAVVCHDEELGRVTSASGPVGAVDADDLAELGVPRLAPALQACAPLPVTLELKEAGALIDAVAPVVAACGRASQILIASFDDQALAAWRARWPAHPTSLSESEAAALVESAWAGRAPAAPPAGAVAVQLPHQHQHSEIVTGAVIAAAHGLDLAVHVWTVNDDASMRRLCHAGVDGIITDHPTALRTVCDEAAASS